MTKVALLIGINYVGQSGELAGCINDVLKVKAMLVGRMGYADADITLMTDESPPGLKPTASNIMAQLGRVILKAYHDKADEVWVHYSGHGSYVRDVSGDEDDRRDEVLVPLDYEQSGMIKDDHLHAYFSYVPPACRAVCVFDCCHSGTMLDLPLRYVATDADFEVENRASDVRANVVTLSGCTDTQTAADAYIQEHQAWGGAMTTALLHALEEAGYAVTFFHLLARMRAYLKDRRYKQTPQLCASRRLSSVDVFCAPAPSAPMVTSTP